MNTLYASIPEAINYFHHKEEALQKLKECGKMNRMTQDKFTLKDLLKAEIKTSCINTSENFSVKILQIHRK